MYIEDEINDSIINPIKRFTENEWMDNLYTQNIYIIIMIFKFKIIN